MSNYKYRSSCLLVLLGLVLGVVLGFWLVFSMIPPGGIVGYEGCIYFALGSLTGGFIGAWFCSLIKIKVKVRDR